MTCFEYFKTMPLAPVQIINCAVIQHGVGEHLSVKFCQLGTWDRLYKHNTLQIFIRYCQIQTVRNIMTMSIMYFKVSKVWELWKNLWDVFHMIHKTNSNYWPSHAESKLANKQTPCQYLFSLEKWDITILQFTNLPTWRGVSLNEQTWSWRSKATFCLKHQL